jgi:hypothetical protein
MIECIIIETANEYFNSNVYDKSGTINNTNARAAISNFLKQNNNYKIRDISIALKKDHATVCHYLKLHKNYLCVDKKYEVSYLLFENVLIKPRENNSMKLQLRNLYENKHLSEYGYKILLKKLENEHRT